MSGVRGWQALMDFSILGSEYDLNSQIAPIFLPTVLKCLRVAAHENC